MVTRRPTTAQIAVSVAFAFSCFGLLLWLWNAFGGPVPLAPEGYRFQVAFDEAGQLANESDVRISGVTVGKVKEIELDEDDGLAVATIELDESKAPIPTNTEAMLRQKTLLGETYVELTPGDGAGTKLAEGDRLSDGQVSDAVQLDEIFRTFDEPTREAFRAWMQNSAVAVEGRGADLSAALGNLDSFAAEATDLLRVLDTQRLAVKELVRNGGEVLGALSERRGQLSSLVVNANTVFETTARRDEQLKRTFTAFPPFLRQSRATLARLDRFAADTDPLMVQLRPAARELSGNMRELARLAPHLDAFSRGFRRVARAAPHAMPALRRLVGTDLPPLLDQMQPFLRDFIPILGAVNLYRRDITSFLANVAAISQNTQASPENVQRDNVHYLRTLVPLGPETLAAYPERLTSNRTNPYMAPNGYARLGSGLLNFETSQCAGGIDATLNPADAGALPPGLFDRLRQFAFANQLSTADVPRPPCGEQPPLAPIGRPGPATKYQHVLQQLP